MTKTTPHNGPPYQALHLLHAGFTADSIPAGADRFALLCSGDWYLAPWNADLSPIGVRDLMQVSGVVETAAGIPVAIKPRTGAPAAAACLRPVLANLLSMGRYPDVGPGDFGLAPRALALARLAVEFDNSSEPADGRAA